MQALLLFADNNGSSLPSIDIWFFVICALIVVAIVAIYYLIPVFNKRKYQMQRENLEKREAAFKANRTDATQEASQTEAPVDNATESELNKDAKS